MSAVIVTALVLGLVALQALLAQESFKIDDLQSRLDRLTQLNEEYGLAAARLGSPSRIAAEARNLGMTLPAGGIVVLHVPGGSPAPGPRHKAVAGVRP
jgi:cell division protein FtsL